MMTGKKGGLRVAGGKGARIPASEFVQDDGKKRVR